MSVFIIPPLEENPWPTLGEGVCRFIEERLIHGPGDLRGQQARLDAEKRGLIHRMYEVFPRDHAEAGRRRFRRVAISLRKGSAKTELAAWIVAVELHHEGPVRTVGWDKKGNPIGGPVNDPYIPLVAYTEEQSEDLAYGTLMCVLGEGPLAGDFDIGQGRIMRLDGAGKAAPMATAPAARDGARTTFEVFDETHRLTHQKQRDAHRTMLANLPKRFLADPWSLEVTTAFSPGENSVAESTMDYARLVGAGEAVDSKLFFYHRQAGDHHDLTTKEGRRAAILEASGPVAEWSDVDGIESQWQDPTADTAFLERVWLNRPVKTSQRPLDVELWKTRTAAEPGWRPAPRRLITLGFDGARTRDSTGLMGCDVELGRLFRIGLWERPLRMPKEERWEVPVAEVRGAMKNAFDTWNVWRLYADPPYWEGLVDDWIGEFGDDRVIPWATQRDKAMAYAVRAFVNGMEGGELSHDGDPDLTRHIGNAVRREAHARDEDDKPLWTIQKERFDSPHKIDLATAAILAWEARGDAVAAGALVQPSYEILIVGGAR